MKPEAEKGIQQKTRLPVTPVILHKLRDMQGCQDDVGCMLLVLFRIPSLWGDDCAQRPELRQGSPPQCS